MSAFSSASFSTDAFSVLAFDFGSIPPAPVEVGGHFSDFKKYRQKLERLVKAYEDHDNKKYVKNIVEVAEISEELPVATPEITQAVTALQSGNIPQIDYEQFAQDIYALIAYIERQIEAYQLQMEEEEEMAILMLA